MTLTPSLRKLVFTVHVVTSVGWAGALAVFLAHAVAARSSQDMQVVRAACLAMGIAAWFVLLPLSLGSLASGLLQALGTAWGLFRHYWVLAKLLLTALATGVLLLKLAPIDMLAAAAAETTFALADATLLRTSLLAHATAGLLLLLAITALAVYKPGGMTAYGTRRSREQRAAGQ